MNNENLKNEKNENENKIGEEKKIEKKEIEEEIKIEDKPTKKERNRYQIRRSVDIAYKKRKRIGNNQVNQLYDDKVRHSQENITEQTYGDNNQLSQDKLQSMNNLTDKNQPESASYGHVITIITKEKENSEEDKQLYKKRKGMNTKSIRGSYKRRKFANLVIKLDNKFELKNYFNKWNNMTQINDLEKNKSINVKQIMKDNKNKKIANSIDKKRSRGRKRNREKNRKNNRRREKK